MLPDPAASNVALIAGPMVLVGYLIGSIPFAYALERWRIRRFVATLDTADVLTPADADTTPTIPPDEPPRSAAVSMLEGLAAITAVVLAEWVAQQVSPGGNVEVSRVGAYSSQVVLAWESVAMWTGVGAIVGQMAPIWLRFRGGDGIAPAFALVAWFAPTVFSVAMLGYVIARAATNSHRSASIVALPLTVTVGWIAWIADLPASWGSTNGPETSLWLAIVAGLLATRLPATRPASPGAIEHANDSP